MLGFDRITFDLQGRIGVDDLLGRHPVALVLNLTANGMTAEEIVEAYPSLEVEDVRQALRYAAWLAEDQVLEPAAS